MAFGFFDRIKDGLEKTRKSFVKNVESIVIGYAQIDDDFQMIQKQLCLLVIQALRRQNT